MNTAKQLAGLIMESDLPARLQAENERMREVLVALVQWNARNGTYGELPPLIIAAKKALRDNDAMTASQQEG